MIGCTIAHGEQENRKKKVKKSTDSDEYKLQEKKNLSDKEEY